jgi:aspartate 1-decarboxylase
VKRTMMHGKIHRAMVTGADVDYVGSITIDRHLMDAAGMLEFEQVQVLDVDNGARFETYLMAGEPGSGEVVVNGAAAHLVSKGDRVIVISYAEVDDAEAASWTPKIVALNGSNVLLQSVQTGEA